MTQLRSRLLLVAILCLITLTSCSRSFVAHGPVPLAVDEARVDQDLYMQWLGTSSWIISRGGDVIVVDPFFSRPSARTVASSLLFPWITKSFGYDVKRINDVLPALPSDTKAVLVGHAHYDHVMDVAYYMKQKTTPPNVRYIGGVTARSVLESFRPVHFTFVEARDAIPIAIPNARVRVIPFNSDHAPHFLGITFLGGHLASPPSSFPTTAAEYPTGETEMYLIDFLDSAGAIQWRVFINSAASTPGRAQAMEAHLSSLPVELRQPPDVAILCVPGWDKVADYPESLLRVLKPHRVVLSHYDDFFSPYKNGEDPSAGMRFVMFANYDGFIQRLQQLKSIYGFEFRAPKTGQCLRFPEPPGGLPCER